MANILIVAADFYKDITAALVQGASEELQKQGHTFEVLSVPGAFEIPAAIAFALEGGELYDGFVALGCVIRGETTHYDYVCIESARGINELAIYQQAPIGYGVLTVENEEQAWERALPSRKNKGKAAVEACLTMLAIKNRFFD